jgi:hypothetical protein
VKISIAVIVICGCHHNKEKTAGGASCLKALFLLKPIAHTGHHKCKKNIQNMVTFRKTHFIALVIISICLLVISDLPAQPKAHLKIGVFNADVTPPIGSPVAYAKTRSIIDPLSARGIIFYIDNQQPVVLCAVDWIGISNEGQDVWKKELAEAAHTTADRVSVHVLHQHDGVTCDFTMERIMEEYGIEDTPFDSAFQHKAIREVGDAVTLAAKNTQDVTHIGVGKAKVEKVASNRRILGSDGKVAVSRWSSGNDSATMAKPEGLVDPWLKCVSLWNNERPLAVLTFYASHPQSYYGKGDVTCEFVGRARNNREVKLNGLPHIHFNGAGGNITTGKYNNGTDSLRQLLTKRMETAMQRAWENTKKTALAGTPAWKTVAVTLPLANNTDEEKLKTILSDTNSKHADVIAAAERLAWMQRSKEGVQVSISSLRIGKLWILNLPGELFVEYQLAAQKMKPGEEVCTATYEDLGPGYIGTAISYDEGGYETSASSSGVAPGVEKVLMDAIRNVLK